MMTNDIGIPVEKIHYSLVDINKEAAINRYIDRIKEGGWIIDDKFKEFVSRDSVQFKTPCKCFTYVYFSCDCIQHVENSGIIKNGYSITPNINRTGYDVSENVSSYNSSYDQKTRKSFWVTDHVLPLSDRDFNMYEQKYCNTISREEIKGLNDENKIIKDYVLKYYKKWRKAAKDCSDFRNYKIDKIQLIYVDLCEVAIQYEHKEYKVSGILPTQLSTYVINLNENTVAMSDSYYKNKAKFSEKKEKLLNFGYISVLTISFFMCLAGIIFFIFIKREDPLDIFNIIIFTIFAAIFCGGYVSSIIQKVKRKKYDIIKVNKDDNIDKYLKSIIKSFVLSSILNIIIGLGILLFGILY